MSLVFNAKTYANDVARGSDSFRYLGPLHTAGTPDYVDLYRTIAPAGAIGSVKYKGRGKLTRSVTDGVFPAVLGSGIIADTVISVPTGAATAQIDTFLTDYAAFVATTAFKNAVKNGIINV